MSVVKALQELFARSPTYLTNRYVTGTMQRISTCHTITKGYHLYECDNPNCGVLHHQYHSCGNRNCPICGANKAMEWVEARREEVLPTPYYHVVFTLPHELNTLILGNQAAMYQMLFEASSQTLLRFGENPKYLGAMIGITSVLHTWGQNLSFHPHAHCIVSGGGLQGEKWIKPKRKKATFLFPIGGMKKMFKGIFLQLLRKKIAKQEIETQGIDVTKMIQTIGYKQWNIYAKAPFAGAQQVIAYLGKYTHKTAIGIRRIKSVENGQVTFTYRDYADRNKEKLMQLNEGEFLRRFAQHLVPARFVKIRHYGYVQNRGKKKRLETIRKALRLSQPKPRVKIPIEVRMLELGVDITKCKVCKVGTLKLLHVIQAHETPHQTWFVTRNKASPEIFALETQDIAQ